MLSATFVCLCLTFSGPEFPTIDVAGGFDSEPVERTYLPSRLHSWICMGTPGQATKEREEKEKEKERTGWTKRKEWVNLCQRFRVDAPNHLRHLTVHQIVVSSIL